MNLRTPLARVRGLGSAKDGVHHWSLQRLTAIALVPLAIWFMAFAVSLTTADIRAVTASIGHPVNASLMCAFLIALFWHAQLGLQVVIEDYINSRRLGLTLQIAVRFACVFGVVVGVLAIIRIALAN